VEDAVLEIRVDNMSAIVLAKNPVFHDLWKHIDTRYHYIRECIERGKIVIDYITTEVQITNILTKELGRVRFQELRARIGVKNLPSDSIKG
jgi:hypothetical protein